MRDDVERQLVLRELSRQFPQKLDLPQTREPLEQIFGYKHDLLMHIDQARDVRLFLHLADMESFAQELSEDMYMRYFNLTVYLRKAVGLHEDSVADVVQGEAATLLRQIKGELIEFVDAMDYREVYEFVCLNPFLMDPEECARLEATDLAAD